ncbi:MAG TPA: amidohydrolase family protein [Acidimicrobiia bacterium]|jgi:predicted TIM-barrel fold metal-dependent hydrolase
MAPKCRAIATGVDGDDRYIVISADCHGGGNVLDYRPYLESRWHDAFDAWAADYEVPYDDLTGDNGERNWDSARRQADLERDGVVAEVIFPNTVPPFFPKASLTAQPPAVTTADAEQRWAGLQAHNRWLADFCGSTPGRRAGVIQINLHDPDASATEIRRAVESGLTGGVLLPGTPPGLGLPQLFDECYEPIWRVCSELGVPVNHHTGSAAPPMGPTDVDAVVFLLEVSWWAHRALTHLIAGGVLERHPDLQLVFTEQGTAWVPDELMRLDYFFDRMGSAEGSQEAEWGRAVVGRLSLRPNEYWKRQCHVGASFIRPAEVGMRALVGVDKIMWGSDYPHKESSHPFSVEALRAAFAGVPVDEVAEMVGGNAARLYGFDLDVLRPVAAAWGPRVADVDRPLGDGDVPSAALKCPAFASLPVAAS